MENSDQAGPTNCDLEQLTDLQAEPEGINSFDLSTASEPIEAEQVLPDYREAESDKYDVNTPPLVRSLIPETALPPLRPVTAEIALPPLRPLTAETETAPPPFRPLTPETEIAPPPLRLLTAETAPPLLRPLTSETAPPPLTPFTAKTAPPPSRSPNITPKPSNSSLPMALETTAVVRANSEQPIVLMLSPGSANTMNLPDQTMKAVSSQAQAVKMPNLKKVAIGNKVVELRIVNKNITAAVQTSDTTTSTTNRLKSKTIKNLVPQNKNIGAKIIAGAKPGQVILSQANESGQPQQRKLITIAPTKILSNAKVITLAQAQEMGLLTSGSVQKVVPELTNKQTIVANKAVPTRTVKIVPQAGPPIKTLPALIKSQKIQTQMKPERKILPVTVQRQKIQPQMKPERKILPVTVQRQKIQPANNIQHGVITTSSILPSATNQELAPVQIHEINMPTKGLQYLQSMTTNRTTDSHNQAKSITETNMLQKAQNVSVPVTGISVYRKVTPITSVMKVMKPTAIEQLIIPENYSSPFTKTKIAIPVSSLRQSSTLPSDNNVKTFTTLATQNLQQIQSQKQIPTAPKIRKITQTLSTEMSPSQAKENIQNSAKVGRSNFTWIPNPNEFRQHKTCNCSRTFCLQLYCDCFASGEFCNLCGCINCKNNLENEDERQRTIRYYLEKNSNTFKPKVRKNKNAGESSMRKHIKGCKCKRSNCLKNYCECFEANVVCSNNCKCIGCINRDESMETNHERQEIEEPNDQVQAVSVQEITTFRPLLTNTSIRTPSTSMTTEFIETTNQCMLARAREAESNMLTEEAAKSVILKEFARCLSTIIGTGDNS